MKATPGAKVQRCRLQQTECRVLYCADLAKPANVSADSHSREPEDCIIERRAFEWFAHYVESEHDYLVERCCFSREGLINPLYRPPFSYQRYYLITLARKTAHTNAKSQTMATRPTLVQIRENTCSGRVYTVVG